MSEHTSRFTEFIGDDIAGAGIVSCETEEDIHYDVNLPLDENMLPIDFPDGESLPGHGKTHEWWVNDYRAGQNPDGTWPQKLQRCGDFKSFFVREDTHKARRARVSCHLQECPKDFRTWARVQAEKTGGYLWELARLYNRTLAHWVLSPAEGWDVDKTPEEVWAGLDALLRRFIRQFSTWNDTIIAVTRHPGRKHCPECHLSGPELDHKRFCPLCRTELHWRWSAHLHVVSDFRYAYESASDYVNFEAANSCIFTEIAKFPTKEDLCNCLAYEFGHSRWVPGKQTPVIRYMGFSAKNHFRGEKIPVKEDAKDLVYECPRCSTRYDNDTPCWACGIPCNPIELGYYKVQDQCCEEVTDTSVRVRKFRGKIPWELDAEGNRIPLQKTHYDYHITPLMRLLNGKWVRLVPPRKREKPVLRNPTFTAAREVRFLNAKVSVVPKNFKPSWRDLQIC